MALWDHFEAWQTSDLVFSLQYEDQIAQNRLNAKSSKSEAGVGQISDKGQGQVRIVAGTILDTKHDKT